jgi:hypothetical protein
MQGEVNMKLAVSLTLATTGSVIAIGAICFFNYAPTTATPPQAIAVPATHVEREKNPARFDTLMQQVEVPDHTASVTKRNDPVPTLPRPACANADVLGVMRSSKTPLPGIDSGAFARTCLKPD